MQKSNTENPRTLKWAMMRDWFFTRRKQTEETMTFSALKKDRHATPLTGPVVSDLTTMTGQDKVS